MAYSDPRKKASEPLSARSAELHLENLCAELLVLRAKAGDARAFEVLVKSWHERLWRHAFRLTHSEETAWDVMQESWLGISRGIARLEEPKAFRRWAYTIVTRAAVVQLRRKPRENPRPIEEIDRTPKEESDRDERQEAVLMLRLALKHLEPKERALVSMRYLEGFELWELAQILEIPEGTVKSRLHRARTRLREILERLQP